MSATFALQAVAADRFDLRGRIDVGNAALALLEGQGHLGRQPASIDLSALESADGVTLAVLVAWAAHAARRGQALRFTGVGGRLAAIARLCAVEPLLGIAAER